MTTTTRARVIATLLLVLVAGTGFAAGVFTQRVVLDGDDGIATAVVDAPDGMRVLIRGSDTPAGSARRVRVLLPGRLAEELGLTPAQQAEIERIVREDQETIRRITEELEPALRAVVERSRQRIEEVLTDEQRERWRAMPAMRLRRDVP